MKTMINLLQLTVFLTKCYVLVIVSEVKYLCQFPNHQECY